jgi:16S rRNA (adenine1518-N6/adenine1519-N6)-dimethyltransferase
VATVRTRRQELGQHFLRDPGTARAIVAALADEPPRVLEIGPGRGALTRALLERFPRVCAVELDGRLAAALAERLGDPAGLEVRRGDGLNLDLDELAEGGPWQVAANLPYSVGTPILRRLLPRHDVLTVVVVMVQLEVAHRLVAAPGGAKRGLLTLETETHARAGLLFTVPPRCFSPPPRVTSAVVRLALHAPPAAPAVVERALALASAAFTHRRKKLANALASVAPSGVIAAALATLGADGGVRPQDVPLAFWLALAEALPAPEDG